MTTERPSLGDLTGLTDDELADALVDNPRAYMAVKGAVAEKHLEKILLAHIDDGSIASVRVASGDSDKDFYVTLPDGRELSIECKNIEVIKTQSKAARVEYLAFLHAEGELTTDELELTADMFDGDVCDALSQLSATAVGERIKALPQHLRESGMSRYQFSRQMLAVERPQPGATREFLEQFDDHRLTIDFQRTRNSTDADGDSRRNRLYSVGEIDIVGACLFSRTTHWDFIFAKAANFALREDYPDRYATGVKIQPDHWTADVTNLFD